MPKFEIEITRADIDAIREALADTLEGDESDEDIIREAFYFSGYGTEEDLRSKVRIKQLADSARAVLRDRQDHQD